MEIDGKQVGGNASPCFIAEAGVNHNGGLEQVECLIDAAAKVGTDAVKFQTFRTDQLVSKDADLADYQENSTDEYSQTRYSNR